MEISMVMKETGDSLCISQTRQEELHKLCQTIVSSGCDRNLNCPDTIREIQKYQDTLTCQELIFVTFKLGRIFQVAQDNPPKELV